MSLNNIINIAGSGMSAQSVRLNTTASNIANAESISGNKDDVYKAKHPVFTALLESASSAGTGVHGVKVDQIIESSVPAQKRYEPSNPLSDKDGYVYIANVNLVEEMADMIAASRSYQNNVEVMNTAKQMLMSTLKLGQ